MVPKIERIMQPFPIGVKEHQGNESRKQETINTGLNLYNQDSRFKMPDSKLLQVYFTGKTHSNKTETRKDLSPEQASKTGVKHASKLDHQFSRFLIWAEKEQKKVKDKYPDWDFHIHPIEDVKKVSDMDPVRKKEFNSTMELFKNKFSTFLWTGEECSNPTAFNEKTGKEERWDQLKLINLYNKKERLLHAAIHKELDIHNTRLGIPNHKILNSRDMEKFSNTFLKDFHDSGIKISLDLLHFGLPDKFRNEKDPKKSYFLNPEWPDYFVNFARIAVQKCAKNIEAITIINEPFITNRFSGQHWNERFPGNRNSPEYKKYFIERALLISKAAVKARYEIEKHIQSQPEPEKARKIFLHNDSCENRPQNKDFTDHERFLSSDLILGQDWLLKDDFKQSDMFKWMEKNYDDKEKLINSLQEIKDEHLKFQKDFNKTMKADTVFGIDYYAPCESGDNITPDPKNYAKEVESGHRKGLYGMIKEYYERYDVPIIHAETNMREEHQQQWITQQAFDIAQSMKSGIPVLGFNYYSLMDQYGWDKALKDTPGESNQNHIGLVNPNDKSKRSGARQIIPEIFRVQSLEKVL